MNQEIKMQFLQILLNAYRLGEYSLNITTDQVLKEITPQLKALLTVIQQT